VSAGEELAKPVGSLTSQSVYLGYLPHHLAMHDCCVQLTRLVLANSLQLCNLADASGCSRRKAQTSLIESLQRLLSCLLAYFTCHN
jgi:hypothetical protein